LQCAAVCCSVLQCVAVCCSVLQCVAVCCSVLQCVVQVRMLLLVVLSLHASESCLQGKASYDSTSPSLVYPQPSLLLKTIPNVPQQLYTCATHCVQHTATRCNTLQHAATHCNTLQHIATHCNKMYRSNFTHVALAELGCHNFSRNAIAVCVGALLFFAKCLPLRLPAKPVGIHELYTCATRCNTLHHAATHCNTLYHTATHCNTRQYTATHCTTLQHTATHGNTLQRTAAHYNTLAIRQQSPTRFTHFTHVQHTATRCKTRQHTTTHGNTRQRTATHCNTLQPASRTRQNSRTHTRHSSSTVHSPRSDIVSDTSLLSSFP